MMEWSDLDPVMFFSILLPIVLGSLLIYLGRKVRNSFERSVGRIADIVIQAVMKLVETMLYNWKWCRGFVWMLYLKLCSKAVNYERRRILKHIECMGRDAADQEHRSFIQGEAPDSRIDKQDALRTIVLLARGRLEALQDVATYIDPVKYPSEHWGPNRKAVNTDAIKLPGRDTFVIDDPVFWHWNTLDPNPEWHFLIRDRSRWGRDQIVYFTRGICRMMIRMALGSSLDSSPL